MSHEQSESQSKHKHVTLGLVCAWVFGVLFAISAITYLAEGNFIASIISLLMAAILIPPIWEKLQTQIKVKFSSGVKIVIVIIGLVLVGIVSNTDTSTSQTPTTSVSSTTMDTKTEETTSAELDLELLSQTASASGSGDYVYIEGEVKNLTGYSIENIQAVVRFYDVDGNFITSDYSYIEYDPLLSGQTSPFKVMVRRNPAMESYIVEFKESGGGTFEIKRSNE